MQRFKGSKVDAYKPLGHSITHTIQCTILCKEETKIGQRNYMKCLARTKISSLPPANNSTINSELTRGGMAIDEVFKVRKFCSLIVTEWAGFSANVR